MIAKQVALLLAENGATVSDLPYIFEKVRERLRVVYQDVSENGNYSFNIVVPKERTKDGETYIPSPLNLAGDCG